MFAPFSQFLALIIFDGDFNLPQHLFAGLADGRTQSGDGCRRVEIKNTEEILVLKVVLRLHAAAGQENVGSTDHRRASKGRFDVEVIVLFQKGAFNEVENVVLIIIPVFIHQLGSHMLQLIGKSIFAGNPKAPLQGCRHRIPMLLPVLPKVRTAGVFSAAGIRHIEYISQLGIVSVGEAL